MGVFFLLVMMLLVGDVATLLVKLASRFRGVPLEPERRVFISRAVASVAGIGALLLGVGGAISVAARTAIKHVPIRLAKLAKEHQGFTIVQVTDLHVGPTIGKEFVEEVVRQVNELRADVVVITGDLVDGSVADLSAHVAPLGKLQAKHGVFFVTGNHEYYSGVDEWLAYLGKLGIRVLRNEHVDLGAIHLAGVDDSGAHQFGNGHGEDIPKAVLGRAPHKPVVLLAHQPRAIDAAADNGVDLQLSGHTHGGQIIPWNFFVRLQQPYVAGLVQHRSAQLYVSCGTGYWGPPMRVGVPAEITRIELLAG
jgi:predicted MPP superfamily phosphohydrolase